MESKVTVTSETERAIARMVAQDKKDKQVPFAERIPFGMDERDWINASDRLIRDFVAMQGTRGRLAAGTQDLRMYGGEFEAKVKGLCVCCGSTIDVGEKVHFARIHPMLNETPNGGRYWIGLRAGCFVNQAVDHMDSNRDRALALLDDAVPAVVRSEEEEHSKEDEGIGSPVGVVAIDEEKPKRRRASK